MGGLSGSSCQAQTGLQSESESELELSSERKIEDAGTIPWSMG